MFDCPCNAQFCIEIDYSNRFRLKNKNKKPCAVLDFAHYLDQKPVIKFAWPNEKLVCMHVEYNEKH